MKAPERGALPLGLAATLGRAYGRLTETVQGLSDADFRRETRCPGMPVGPLLVHLLYDAERALIAFASPAAVEPDRDFVTYWKDVPPPARRDGQRHARPAREPPAAARLEHPARTPRRTGPRGRSSRGWRVRTRSADRRRGSLAGGPGRGPCRSRPPCTPRDARSRTI